MSLIHGIFRNKTILLRFSLIYKGLKEFIDLDQTKDRLGKIDTSKIGDKEKFAVDLFLKDFDKKDKNTDFDD